METSEYLYQADTLSCKGYVAYPSKIENPPIVMIVPTWEGLNSFAKEQAENMAMSGYVGFAVDIYGNGITAEAPEEASKLMLPLFTNRALLRKRILAAYAAAKEIPNADHSKIAAMGFCFGGLTVIELMKSGAHLSAAISFHPVLANQMFDHKAILEPMADQIKTPFLLLHGYKDPLVPAQDLLNLQQELSAKNVDWQIHIYGTAAHAFTNPDACDTAGGMYFDKRSRDRSMKTLYHYLKEVFNE